MKLKNNLKETLEKGKRLGKKAVTLIIVAATIGSMGLLAANAPTLHKAWLRGNVGSRVVKLVAIDKLGQIRGGGTGFQVVAPSGVSYLLTNAHVCEAFPEGSVNAQLGDGRIMPRRILEISDRTDLCLVEGIPGMDGLKLASNVDIGQTLALIGHPVLQPLSISLGDIVGQGIEEFPYAPIAPSDMSDRERARYPDLMSEAECKSKPKFKVKEMETFFGSVPICVLSIQAYKTTIIAFPGNSGSPVVNFWGNLSGVLYAGNGRTNWGLVVPLESIKEFLAPY